MKLALVPADLNFFVALFQGFQDVMYGYSIRSQSKAVVLGSLERRSLGSCNLSSDDDNSIHTHRISSRNETTAVYMRINKH